MEAKTKHIEDLANTLGILEPFKEIAPKQKHPSWLQHDLAALWLHEFGHLCMGHLDPYSFGFISGIYVGEKLNKSFEELRDFYGFTDRQCHFFVASILHIPYQPDEWSVQYWAMKVSDSFGWENTYGNAWQTESPQLSLRKKLFDKKDDIGLVRAGVDIENGIFMPTYTHLVVEKCYVSICAGDRILDTADLSKWLTNVDIFERVQLETFNLVPKPFSQTQKMLEFNHN